MSFLRSKLCSFSVWDVVCEVESLVCTYIGMFCKTYVRPFQIFWALHFYHLFKTNLWYVDVC
jgi:hypothetical protein